MRNRAKFRADWSNRCRHITIFWIFQDGVRSNLGFVKFLTCNGRNGQEGRTAPSCQI